MDLFLPLITIFAVSWLFLWWPALRRVATFRRPSAGVLRDSEVGYAQVRLPPRWRPSGGLNEQATLQAIDPLLHRSVLVISESRGDFDPAMKLEEHAAITVEILAASLQVVGFHGPQQRRVAGLPAIQYELEGFHERTWLKYLHTTIEGQRAFHQLVAWAPHTKYSREVFEQLLEGFEELPGPSPETRGSSILYQGPPQSRYDAH
jgi:hypothetical protein